MTLLDGLDRVPWSRLHHAYGAAVDVPGLLRALVDPDSASATLRAAALRDKRTVFDAACWELYGNVFHQGSVWQASAPTVPFFVEILGSEIRTPALRRFILKYLAHLAIGYPEDSFPAPFDPDRAFRSVEGIEDDGSEPGPRRLQRTRA